MTSEGKTGVNWGMVLLIVLALWFVPSMIIAVLGFIAFIIKVIIIAAIAIGVFLVLRKLYHSNDTA